LASYRCIIKSIFEEQIEKEQIEKEHQKNIELEKEKSHPP
jgi:hypothetical protein